MTGMPSRLALLGAGVLGGSLVVLNVWVAAAYGGQSWQESASEIAVGVSFAGAGLAAWWLRPRSSIGRWMVALAVTIHVSNLSSTRPALDAPGRDVMVIAGIAALWLQYPIIGRLILSYPSGTLPGRTERILFRVGLTVALAGGALVEVTRVPVPLLCRDRCAPNPIGLIADEQLYLGIRMVLPAVWFVLGGLMLALLVRRMLRATPWQRRTLGFALVAAALTDLVFLWFLALQFAVYYHPAEGAPYLALAGPINVIVGWGGVTAVPFAFLAGLLRERLAFAAVGDLVGRLEHVAPDTVEAALRETLRDPSLRVAFPSGTSGELLDAAGAPYHPIAGEGRALTTLGASRVAVLDHDRALLENRQLLDAAGAAARLALDNARLQAQLLAQLAEVRASRARIVAATDEARRRLERDLHDGAQQRLLEAGLALQSLRTQIDPDGPAARLLAETEQALTGALCELRDLAAGIHPAVLTDQGLRPALLALSVRSPLMVHVDGDPGRLSPPVESTAYFCASEAVTNAIKHAHATTVRVCLRRNANRLLLSVADDGIGGASASGTGLRGLADRVSTLGGELTITSPPGRGTTVTVELPCG
ncbi:hypothetical protein J5X84_39700 [Streptosporangiaceae bacterium NEAU-GS5]|nr:hypothetical protein [Streptosporangiaceae bacterium NEAU-GS5]